PEKSIRAYSEALRLWQAVKSLSGEALALQGLSLTYWSIGAAHKAYDAVVQTLPVVRALHDRGGEAIALCNLGLAGEELGRKEIALERFREAHAIWEGSGDPRRAFSIYNIAHVVQALGQTPRAGETWKDVREVSRRLGNRGVEATALSSLAC